MRTSVPRFSAAALLVALLLPLGAAHAQLNNLLNQSGGSGGAAGGLGSLGSVLSPGSATSGSLGNVTGLLQYCIQNNYLNAGSASGVKDSLLSKLPGGAATTDSGYQSGTQGILKSSSGSQLDLSGGGLKAEATKQVCDKILSQAKSML